MAERLYLIDFEISGSLGIHSTNPQAAAARAGALLRRAAEILNAESPDDAGLEQGPPIDVGRKIVELTGT